MAHVRDVLSLDDTELYLLEVVPLVEADVLRVVASSRQVIIRRE